MTYPQFWRINAVVIAVMVAILSLTPDTEKVNDAAHFTVWIAQLLLGDGQQSDKVGHFLAYGALGFFTILGIAMRPRWVALTFVGLLAYGALLEIFQGFTQGRTKDGADMLANGLGAFCGIFGGIMARGLWALTGINIPFPGPKPPLSERRDP